MGKQKTIGGTVFGAGILTALDRCLHALATTAGLKADLPGLYKEVAGMDLGLIAAVLVLIGAAILFWPKKSRAIPEQNDTVSQSFGSGNIFTNSPVTGIGDVHVNVAEPPAPVLDEEKKQYFLGRLDKNKLVVVEIVGSFYSSFAKSLISFLQDNQYQVSVRQIGMKSVVPPPEHKTRMEEYPDRYLIILDSEEKTLFI